MPYSSSLATTSTAVAPPASAVPAPSFPPAPPLMTPLLSAPLRSAITTALAEPASAEESASAEAEVDASGQGIPANATPVTTPRPAVMLPTPTPPRPASVAVPPIPVAAGGAGAGAGVRTTSTSSILANTPLFTTTYSSAVRGFNGAPFRASRTEPSVFFQFDNGGLDPLGNDMTGLGNSTQLLTNLLGLAFGDTAGGLGGLATGGLPASFLEPVVVRPTATQVDAASEVLTLSAPLEGNCAVCQDNLDMGNMVRRLTACTHTFHQECIDTWFERSVQCPVCRHDIREMPAPAPPSNTPPELD